MNTNPRRRFKNLLPTSEDRAPQKGRVPTPAPCRPSDKAAGSAELFADFLAAFMTLSPDKLADWE